MLKGRRSLPGSWIRLTVVLTLSAVVLSLSGCRLYVWGGEEQDDDFGFFFAIWPGTSGASVPRVSPGIDQGRFVLVWSVQGTDEVWLRYFLSTDGRLRGNDLPIGESLCSQRGPDCRGEIRESCQFDSSMNLLCGLGQPASTSNFFTQLPQQAYVIARACSLAQAEQCLDRSHALEFY